MPVPSDLWSQVAVLAATGIGIDDIMVRLRIAGRFRNDVKTIVFTRQEKHDRVSALRRHREGQV